MVFVVCAFLCMFVGMFAYAFLLKHGGGVLSRLSVLSRFSSPFNALVTFALCLVFFLAVHNRLSSSLGGSLVIVGAVTVLGHGVRAVRLVLARLGGVRVPVPVRRKKGADGYWEFVNGEWVEMEREQEAGPEKQVAL